jgi:hypothetical protein
LLTKLGIDISRLKRPIRRALNVIEGAYREKGLEAVITSTYEGNHIPSSLHYANLAVDIRCPKENRARMKNVLANRLGKEYDVILEEDHIHIEYDPKTIIV